MNSPVSTIMLWVIFLLLAPIQAAEPSDALPDSVLLLRNGEVISGPITKVGDRYVVMLGDGSELRIAVSAVEMHCLNLDEAYLRKRSTANPQSAASHLALVDWCLRNSLHQHAADELLRAIAIDPRHPKIAWFERRLESAVQQPRAEEPDSHPKQLKSVNLEKLERTMQDLPEEAVEAFVSQVQPLLLNRCGATTCHGTRATSDFHLVRPGWGKTITRRFTQRNLYATLQTVDFAAPQDSRLLLAPSEPHGNVAGAIFGDRDEEQLRLLIDWVRQVTSKRSAPELVSEPATDRLMQTSYDAPVHLPQTGSDDAPINQASRQPAVTGRPAPAPLSSTSPRDPFDPEVFNRRFLDQ